MDNVIKKRGFNKEKMKLAIVPLLIIVGMLYIAFKPLLEVEVLNVAKTTTAKVTRVTIYNINWYKLRYEYDIEDRHLRGKDIILRNTKCEVGDEITVYYRPYAPKNAEIYKVGDTYYKIQSGYLVWGVFLALIFIWVIVAPKKTYKPQKVSNPKE